MPSANMAAMRALKLRHRQASTLFPLTRMMTMPSANMAAMRALKLRYSSKYSMPDTVAKRTQQI